MGTAEILLDFKAYFRGSSRSHDPPTEGEREFPRSASESRVFRRQADRSKTAFPYISDPHILLQLETHSVIVWGIILPNASTRSSS